MRAYMAMAALSGSLVATFVGAALQSVWAGLWVLSLYIALGVLLWAYFHTFDAKLLWIRVLDLFSNGLAFRAFVRLAKDSGKGWTVRRDSNTVECRDGYCVAGAVVRRRRLGAWYPGTSTIIRELGISDRLASRIVAANDGIHALEGDREFLLQALEIQ